MYCKCASIPAVQCRKAKKIYSDSHVQIVVTRRMNVRKLSDWRKLHRVPSTCFYRPISDGVQLSEELIEELEVLMKDSSTPA